ncbi:hypothetical protein CPB84DRAFT_1796174 [Gymnopilus junonius]|uniref:Uncharacterized protein n=1 Tax=Gymnopilus junonius TaxID=109634 RepID=A0A9P5NC54_GYMJU|nr:hypothetical protein CPB84DRAFT_1796174 [Gymnopilus junonius]
MADESLVRVRKGVFVGSAGPEIVNADSVCPVACVSEIEGRTLFPVGGVGFAVEEGEGFVWGREADEDLDAVGIDGADTGEDDMGSGVEEGGDGEVCCSEEEQRVDGDIGVGEETGGRGEGAEEDGQGAVGVFLGGIRIGREGSAGESTFGESRSAGKRWRQ